MLNLGVRKLIAWVAVFSLAAACMVLQRDVPPAAKELLEFSTGAFFISNAVGKFAKTGGPS